MDNQLRVLELIFNTISDKSVDRSTALLSTRNLINSSSQENINSSEPDTEALKHLLNLLKKNAFNAALEFGNALLPTFNESPLLLNLLGNAYQAVNNLDLAIEKFDKATELKPNFFDAHFNLANACASKPSDVASKSVCADKDSAALGDRRIMELRFWKSYTPRGDAKRAVPKVGST